MPLDHGLRDRAQETSDDRWEQKPGNCPLSDDVVAEESPPHITGDGRDDDVLPAAVVPGRTEAEDWADLSSGLLRKTNGTRTTSPDHNRSYAASRRLFQRSASTGSVMGVMHEVSAPSRSSWIRSLTACTTYCRTVRSRRAAANLSRLATSRWIAISRR